MSASETKINIGKEVKALLDKLGLNGPDVGEIHLVPGKATITVFKRDNKGDKYLVDAGPAYPYLTTGNEDEDVTSFSVNRVPATEVKTYEVRT